MKYTFDPLSHHFQGGSQQSATSSKNFSSFQKSVKYCVALYIVRKYLPDGCRRACVWSNCLLIFTLFLYPVFDCLHPGILRRLVAGSICIRYMATYHVPIVQTGKDRGSGALT